MDGLLFGMRAITNHLSLFTIKEHDRGVNSVAFS